MKTGFPETMGIMLKPSLRMAYIMLSGKTYSEHHGDGMEAGMELPNIKVSEHCNVCRIEWNRGSASVEYAIYFIDARFPEWLFMVNFFDYHFGNYGSLGNFASNGISIMSNPDTSFYPTIDFEHCANMGFEDDKQSSARTMMRLSHCVNMGFKNEKQ